MKKVKLNVSVPSARDWKPAFGSALCGLVHQAASQGIKGVELGGFALNIMQGASILPRARQIALGMAIQNGFTHLLFLDDDMTFPADILDYLFRHEADVIGVNYVRKNPKSPNPQTHDLNGQPLSSIGKTGGEEVAWIGFGVTLIDLDSVKDIPAPMFEMRWLEDKKDFIGEDYYFCGKARNHGVKIFVDHDASNKCTHVGDFHYREAA